MILDVGSLLKDHWQKLTISAVSVIGTTVGGAWYHVNNRIDNEMSAQQPAIAQLQKDTSEIKGNVDTILTLMGQK